MIDKRTLPRFVRIAAIVVVAGLGVSVSEAKFSHGKANARGGAAFLGEGLSEEDILEKAERRAQKRKADAEKAEIAKAIENSEKLKRAEANKRPIKRLAKRLTSMIGFGSSEVVLKQSGYLYYKEPASLRFAENAELKKRMPSPALPEFSLLSNSYQNYLIETPLDEDELRDNSFYSEVVVEMEPHVLISGDIDFGEDNLEMTESQRLEIEEEREAILRPEDVLIFFETENRKGNKATAILPFAPSSSGGSEPTKSSATYKIVE